MLMLNHRTHLFADILRFSCFFSLLCCLFGTIWYYTNFLTHFPTDHDKEMIKGSYKSLEFLHIDKGYE